MRQHLISAEKQTGRKMDALDSVHVPDGFDDIFETYWRLQTCERMKYSEIVAYCYLYNVRFESWELDALRVMDNETQSYIAEQLKGGL